MFKYIYIDESGDLGFNKESSKNVIIAALIVNNPAPLDRIIKNMRRNKFKKELKGVEELKANKLKKEIIKYTLTKINEIKEAHVVFMILEKEKLRSDFLKNDKNKCYNFIAGKLAKNLSLNNLDIEIRIDKSKNKIVMQEDFNQYFEKCLREKSQIGKYKISHVYSQSWSGIQLADILAWSAFQKVEHNNSEYIDLITIQKDSYNLW